VDAVKLIALELFREGRVSLGRAAELARIGLAEFIDFAAQRGVPLNYTLEELTEDRQTAARLKL
jgi:predicted HTH domain antitoxin